MMLTPRAPRRAVVGIGFLLVALANSTSETDALTQKMDSAMTRAVGTFEVKLAPLTLADADAGKLLGRMSLDKQFHGDLEGTSKGEMLSALTDIKDSAGYVAIERVSGSLNGRRGTFILQHSGVMNRGAQQLIVTVVPDSGTGQLTGLAGKMAIIIEGKKHSYEFDYSLPPD
jgi:hypothetical protein